MAATAISSRNASGVAPMTVLLACAAPDPARRGALPELAAACDWDSLIPAAGAHNLLPLLYWRLRETPHCAPAAQWQLLRENFERSARFNLALASQLRDVLRALESSGVPALAFKGPVLAATVHGNLALRNSSDLDLLIPQQKLAPASDALTGCGFRPLHLLTRRQRRALPRVEFELDFVDSERRLVDLHWQFVPRHLGIEFDFAALWERRRAVDLGGVQVATLSPEDTILAVALHGSKHLWSRLCWLWDLAEAIEVPRDLDWDALLQRARTAGGTTMLLIGLLLARDLLGARLPELAADELRLRPTAARIARSIAADLKAGSVTGLHGRWAMTLRMLDSTRQRGAAIAKFLCRSGPGEWSSLRLPDSMFWLYPAVRFGRLAGLVKTAPHT